MEDNGTSISNEQQAQIFGVLERLHGQESYPGIGMSLAIVPKAVECMNDTLAVESQVGQGSPSWIRLLEYNV